MSIQTPKGVRDFVPEQTKLFEQTCTKVSTAFEKAGYQKIQTPTLEYFDSLAVGMGETLDKVAVKLLDPHGKVIVLRPDHTVPIARLVASRHEELHFPLRLYYMNPIFRASKQSVDQDIEIFQAGVELIGAESSQGDSEIISVCVQALANLGITDIGIEIGHVDFLNEWPQDKQPFVLKGDYVAVGALPDRGTEAIVSGYPDLLELALQLKKNNTPFFFNKGLTQKRDYYSGVIFEVYSNKTKQLVAVGGRYDSLLEKYGWKSPAVGVALCIPAVLRELEK